MAAINIRYVAEPTARKFHRSKAFVRGIMGPIGSGKSVACIMEIFRLCRTAKPGNDGVRRSRWAIIRNTYPELKSTTIKTWEQWIPAEVGKIRWDSPITCFLRFEDVEAEVIFLALDQPKDVRKLLSLELTGAFINEAREISYEVVRAVISRLGRYPSKAMGGFDWSGLIMDTNPPGDDHWWYRCAEVERNQGWEFWRQPGALVELPDGSYAPNPAAENVKNHTLGYEYWVRQVPGAAKAWVKTMLCGQYGTVMDGKPIFTDYRDDLHCADKVLEWNPQLPIYLGFDYGRTPACAILQVTPKGQVRWLDEVLVDADGEGNGMGIRTFMREVVMPHMRNHYPGATIVAYGDPAGASMQQGDEVSCMDIQLEEGMVVMPAPGSNDPLLRVDAVAKHMKLLIDGEPGFLISPKCVVGRKALNGGYRVKRLQTSGEARYADRPEKNRFSHIAEALEYGCLGINEHTGMVDIKSAKPLKKRNSRGWT